MENLPDTEHTNKKRQDRATITMLLKIHEYKEFLEKSISLLKRAPTKDPRIESL